MSCALATSQEADEPGDRPDLLRTALGGPGLDGFVPACQERSAKWRDVVVSD